MTVTAGSLWERTKKKTLKSDTIGDVYYSPPDQEEQVDEA